MLKSSIVYFQATRVGAFVNELRKSCATVAPEFSKQCRRVIKSWQQVAEIKHCASGTSSINGTPSPSVASSVTPGRISSNRLTPRAGGRRTPGVTNRLTTPNAENITSGGYFGLRNEIRNAWGFFFCHLERTFSFLRCLASF